jgi:hypothetical protein
MPEPKQPQKHERIRVVGYVSAQLFDRLVDLEKKEGMRSTSHLVDRALQEYERNRRNG